jgi:uncharacterized protein (DUF1919 family)
VTKGEIYNINRFLGYFRRKLLKCDFPTIISNTCIGGRIYEAFDMPLLSPLINTGVEDSDFIKLCIDTKRYMNEELKIQYWSRGIKLDGPDEDYLVAELGDIKILISHIESADMVIESWDLLKERINWSRIVYVMEEQTYRKAISSEHMQQFMKVPGKKLFVKGTSFYEDIAQKPLFLRYEDAPNRREPAIENYFDIVGWINKEN